MHIELSEQARRMIDQQMQSGEFASPEEVVERALGLLTESRLAHPRCVDPATGRELEEGELKALIQEGFDDEAAGRVGPLDVDDIKRRGRERLAARQPSGA